MSDNNDFLHKRNAELEAENKRLTAESMKRKKALRDEIDAHNQLKNAHAEIEKDRDTWKSKAESAPGEWKTKAEEYQSKLRAREATDAWKEALTDTPLHSKVTLEKLWTEIGWKPGDKPPTPEEITEHVKAARESVPYMFKDVDNSSTEGSQEPKSTSTRPPLRDTVDFGRGAPDKNAKRVTVRKSQLQDPTWKLDKRNQEMLTDAQSRGVLDIVDG